MASRNNPAIHVDSDGFVYLDDFKAPIKLDSETAELEMVDRNKYTSRLRGTRFVRVRVAHLFGELLDILGQE